MSGAAYIALAGYDIVTGLQQADLVRDNAALSQQINGLNANAADLDAYNAKEAGYSEEARYQHIIDKTLSDQRVSTAATGVDVNFGTTAELQAETRLNGFLNKADIRNKAAAIALGYTHQAANIRLNGVLGNSEAEIKARAAITQGIANGGKSLVESGIFNESLPKPNSSGLKNDTASQKQDTTGYKSVFNNGNGGLA